jgi:hypothetical protein
MTTSSSICLFHDRQYSSNIQQIVNLLRKNFIKIKCDLNLIVKKCLCTCKLSSNQMMQITDEELIKIEQEFNELKIHQCFKEINQIIQLKIMKKCDNQILINKLRKFICDISTGKFFFKSIQPNEIKSHSNLIRRHIELSLSSNQIGHLLGRDGHLHKKIMKETKTRIHFDNAPYSLDLSSNQCSEFNLDLFQSSCPIQATITGFTIEGVENATKELYKLDQLTQV